MKLRKIIVIINSKDTHSNCMLLRVTVNTIYTHTPKEVHVITLYVGEYKVVVISGFQRSKRTLKCYIDI
jgi:hypothetical protein